MTTRGQHSNTWLKSKPARLRPRTAISALAGLFIFLNLQNGRVAWQSLFFWLVVVKGKSNKNTKQSTLEFHEAYFQTMYYQ